MSSNLEELLARGVAPGGKWDKERAEEMEEREEERVEKEERRARV